MKRNVRFSTLCAATAKIADDEDSLARKNFREEVLPDATVLFSYKFENISGISEPIESPPCYINNLPWRILLMLHPATIAATLSAFSNKKYLSVYLQCNPENVANWSCNASAEISLMPAPQSEAVAITKPIKHLFSPKENDWGFRCFESMELILSPENGYCDNDSITIQMHVTAAIPHGVFYDSKKHTGFVGLTNQGATCYMNSLLQTLFFTNELRRAIYRMPTEADDAKKSVAFALQRVFCDLQFSDRPVGTKHLTQSFGWDCMESFMQHDVQELLRILLEKIETKMRGTSLEGIVPKLFAGRMDSYVRCKHVDYSSLREETFYDIQLSVKGKRSIYESFEHYTAAECLSGENKYMAGEHGLQEAEKGVVFKSFPPVLHLHLMRFQYDAENDICVKFNDHFEFYETIDLTKYLDQSSCKDIAGAKTLAEYRLHAVLVHAGDNSSGHYVVYINVDTKGKWYKFDDDVVSLCSAKEAIADNYGVKSAAEDAESQTNERYARTCSSAYMLSYIHVAEIPNVLKQCTEDAITAEFAEHLAEIKRLEEAEQAMKCKQSMVAVKIALDDCLQIEDLQNFMSSTKIKFVTFEVDATQPLKQFLDLFSNSFKMSKSSFRLWPLHVVKDLVKPIYLDCSESSLEHSLQSLKEFHSPWYLLCQFASHLNLYDIQSFDPKQQVLLFYKLFKLDSSLNLLYVGMSFKTNLDLIGSVKAEFCKMLDELDDSSKCQFNVYEEDSAVLLNSANTLEKSLQLKKSETNAFVLVFEKCLVDASSDIHLYPNFKCRHNSCIEISFMDRADKSNTVRFSLQMPENTSFEELALEVGKKINVNMNRLQFYKTNSPDSVPLKIDKSILVRETLRTRSNLKLFFQTIAIDVSQLQNKLKFPITYLHSNLEEERDFILYVDKLGTVADVIAALKAELKYESVAKNYRMTKIENYWIARFYAEDAKLSDFDQYTENETELSIVRGLYRVEEGTEAESTVISALVPVMHFNKTLRNSFGTPFLIAITAEQTFEQICEQIRKKLLISETEWTCKYKVCLATPNSPYSVKFLSEESMKQIVSLEDFEPSEDGCFKLHIGLNHINKMTKKARDTTERSLKIYN